MMPRGTSHLRSLSITRSLKSINKTTPSLANRGKANNSSERILMKRVSSHKLDNSLELDSVTGGKREDSELSADEHPNIPIRDQSDQTGGRKK